MCLSSSPVRPVTAGTPVAPTVMSSVVTRASHDSYNGARCIVTYVRELLSLIWIVTQCVVKAVLIDILQKIRGITY